MKKFISILSIYALLLSQLAWSGKIQDADVKSLSEIQAAGGSAAGLIHTSKIYDETNSQQLLTSIANGQLGGGGGSGQGVELLTNPGFENGGAAGYVATGGAFSIVTSGSNLLFQHASATFQATASGQMVHLSTPPAIKGLAGGNCSAQIYYSYSGASGDYSLKVVDGLGSTLSSALLAPQAVGLANPPSVPVTIGFPCGNSSTGTLDFQIVSNVASPGLIAFDNLHLGSFSVFAVDTSTPPTVQVFTGGTGTYILPTNSAGVHPRYIEIEMVGGGGGGSAGSDVFNGGNGSAGGNTTFGVSFLTANGGSPGLNTGSNNAGIGGAGGAATVGTGAIGFTIPGGHGSGGAYNGNTGSSHVGGSGGGSAFGGGGGSGTAQNASGSAGAAYGSGGGGGTASGGNPGEGGGGGGAGGYLRAIIANPNLSYSFSVGSGGSGGSAGTQGTAGGAGANGAIIVHEYYVSSQTAYIPSSGGLAAGDVVATASSTCPIGTVPEDGSSYPTSTFPQLFKAISYTYGGSGANFNVPDGRGLFQRGTGTNGTQTLQNGGLASGSAIGTTQQDMLASHTHTYTVNFNAGGISGPQGNSPNAGANVFTGTTGATGGAETRPANIAVNFCIRTVAASAAPVIIGQGSNQPGSVFMWAGATCPAQSVPADGTSETRGGVFSNLYAAIGTVWGTQDVNHFNLPDLRGVVPRGPDNMGTAQGAASRDPDAASRLAIAPGGATTGVGSYQADMFASHFHYLQSNDSSHLDNSWGNGWATSSGSLGTFAGTSVADSTPASSSAGGNETRAKNVYVLFCVQY